jgi:outer membrane protein
MTIHYKSILIAGCIALPTFAFAADNAVVAKPAVPPPVTVSAPVEGAAPPAAVTQSIRIGSVDIVRIGSESERGKALKNLLIKKKDALQGQIDVKKKQIEKLKTSIEAKIATMTPAQREAKSKEFQKKLDEFQKYVRTSEEEFYLLQEKETKALYETIEQTAVAHGKANGFTAIVVKKELFYVSSAVDTKDITDDLIKTLNQAAQKK